MKVSVGICTCNGERFISEQVRSVLNQTVKPDEIIISDDNSSDKTIAIVREELSKCDIPYRIEESQVHLGIRKNFEKVFGLCQGDIIFSCDQDDIWAEDKIESFMPYFEAGYSFVYSNSWVVDSERKLISSNYWTFYGVDFANISIDQFRVTTLTNRVVSGYNMAFTKSLFKQVAPFPEHFIHDDWIAICSSWYGKVAFIDKPLTEYRIHGNNTSGFGVQEDRQEIQKSNKLISESYYSTPPNVWFGNAHLYLASEAFYARMKEVIDARFRTTTKKFITFEKSILACVPKNKLKAILLLSRELITGRYKEFRGGIKRWLSDVVYILVNTNTNYTVDFNIW